MITFNKITLNRSNKQKNHPLGNHLFDPHCHLLKEWKKSNGVDSNRKIVNGHKCDQKLELFQFSSLIDRFKLWKQTETLWCDKVTPKSTAGTRLWALNFKKLFIVWKLFAHLDSLRSCYLRYCLWDKNFVAGQNGAL